MNEYENDLRIDESALDVEWIQQPELMMKYIRLQAEAQQEYDRVHEEVKALRAGLDKDIRENPEKYGIDKLTEGAVDSAIRSKKTFKKKKQEMVEAQYEWNMANGAVSAFHQRRAALENLVKLYGLNYFAGPSMPRDLPGEMSRKRKEEKKSKSIKMKRKNK